MSDIEDNSDYYSDSDSSEGDVSEKHEKNDKVDTNIIPIDSNNIKAFDDEEDDEVVDEEEIDDDDDDDDFLAETQSGGAGDENDSESDNDDNSDSGKKVTGNKKNVNKKPTEIVKSKNVSNLVIEDDEDDDEDDYDESYLQKFDSEITKNYVNEFHPECMIHNYDEIAKLTNVVRDSDNIIVDPLHKTIPFLTKYERARILGQRAKQIETGARPLVKVPENIVDSYVIAELELQQKRIPFIIRRPIPNGGCEYWNLKDLETILF
jgi:DNA-directed RNA polymerase I, II, and III subunit RPABC2